METGLSCGTAFLALVTLFALTTSCCWCFVQVIPLTPMYPRRPASHEHAFCRRSYSGKFCLFPIPSMLRGKTFQEVMFDSSTRQAQRRWAERPVHPLLPIIIAASCPAAILPLIPFHRSAHRHCAWNLPLVPSSTPSRCFPSSKVEAVIIVSVDAEPETFESPKLPGFNPFHPHCPVHGQKRGQHAVLSRESSPSLEILIDRQAGRDSTDCVKTRGAEGFRRDGLQPAAAPWVPSTTKARQVASTFAVEFSPLLCRPAPVRRSLFCPTRPRWPPTGDS